MNAQPTIDVDILVVGASYAGLTMARALSERVGSGLTIGILDRQPLPTTIKPDPRATALSAGAVNAFRRLGIWQTLEAEAQPVARIDITDPIGDSPMRRVLLSYDNDVDGHPASWIVENHHLKTACVGAVKQDPDIEFITPATVTDVALEGTRATVICDNGTFIKCALVVAADGHNSSLRRHAGLKTTGWSYDQTGIVATIQHEHPHEATATQHFLPAGPFAILPLQGARASIVWTETAAVAADLARAAEADVVAALQDRIGTRLGTCTIECGPAFWPLRLQLARQLTAPRMALIGDAARTVHPIAGQGFNLAVRDSAALADAVAEATSLGIDPGNAEILVRYEQHRRFDGTTSALAYDALNRLFSNDNAMLRSLRDAGLELVARSPEAKSFFVREASGLTGSEIPSLMRPLETVATNAGAET